MKLAACRVKLWSGNEGSGKERARGIELGLLDSGGGKSSLGQGGYLIPQIGWEPKISINRGLPVLEAARGLDSRC